ncbi:MAG: UvrD-helicase domain-containing protein, partial [Clostridia bacterium]|nr:UvrD-helicase domain-containing protein [Clostridia bacterium]
MSDINIRDRYLKKKKELFENYFGFLNDQQKEAVFCVNGPLLILAGAGSGKTTVLVHRLSYLLRYGNAYHDDTVPAGVDESFLSRMDEALNMPREELGKFLTHFASDVPRPYEVMAITFTNKAASEIRTRIRSIFGEESGVDKALWNGTFHSVCLRILRRFVTSTPYQPYFSICDTDDQKKTIKKCMESLGIDEKRISVREVIYEISRAKDKLILPDQYLEENARDFKYSEIGRIYKAYQKELLTSNLLDFDDIILQTVLLLKNNEEVRT